MELEIKINKVTFKVDIVCIIRMFLIAFVCIYAIKVNSTAGTILTGFVAFIFLLCKV